MIPHVSSYSYGQDDKLGKDVVNYIKMVDEYNKQNNIFLQAQKKKSEARKKQKIIELKEIKFRPNIEQHDYDVKMRAMRRFLDDGDKVKVTLRFRGREMVHQHLGMNVLKRVRDEMDEAAKVEQMPELEGRQMTMILVPR